MTRRRKAHAVLDLRFDVIIRLREAETAFVDVRVTSRYGPSDLGFSADIADDYLKALDAELLSIAADADTGQPVVGARGWPHGCRSSEKTIALRRRRRSGLPAALRSAAGCAPRVGRSAIARQKPRYRHRRPGAPSPATMWIVPSDLKYARTFDQDVGLVVALVEPVVVERRAKRRLRGDKTVALACRVSARTAPRPSRTRTRRRTRSAACRRGKSGT